MLGAPFKPSFGLSGIMAFDVPLSVATLAQRKQKNSATGFVSGVLTQTLKPSLVLGQGGTAEAVPFVENFSAGTAEKSALSKLVLFHRLTWTALAENKTAIRAYRDQSRSSG
jgi:hypothetical protein